MKYTIILFALLLTIFSCKTKKNIVQNTQAVADTFYVENPKTGELSMMITTKNESPDGSWVLQNINGNSETEVTRISMNLSTNGNEKKVNGNDACNQYNGSLSVFDTRRIEFGPLASTKRACMIPAKYAQLFYSTMAKVKTYHTSNNFLILKDEEGKQLMQFTRKEN